MKYKIAISFIGLVVVVLGGCVFWIFSDSGLRYLVNEVVPVLKSKLGAEISIQGVRGNLWRGFAVSQFYFKIHNEKQDGEVEFSDLNLSYDFSILQKSVDVHEFRIVKPKIHWHQRPQVEASLAKTPEPVSNPAPPIHVHVQNVSVEHMQALIDLEAAENSVHAEIADLNLNSELTATESKLQSSGHFAIGGQNVIQFKAPDKDLKLAANGDLHWQAQLQKVRDHWQINWQPSEGNIELKNIDFVQAAPSAKPQHWTVEDVIGSFVTEKLEIKSSFEIKQLENKSVFKRPVNFLLNSKLDLLLTSGRELPADVSDIDSVDIDSSLKLNGKDLVSDKLKVTLKGLAVDGGGEFILDENLAETLPAAAYFRRNPMLVPVHFHADCEKEKISNLKFETKILTKLLQAAVVVTGDLKLGDEISVKADTDVKIDSLQGFVFKKPISVHTDLKKTNSDINVAFSASVDGLEVQRRGPSALGVPDLRFSGNVDMKPNGDVALTELAFQDSSQFFDLKWNVNGNTKSKNFSVDGKANFSMDKSGWLGLPAALKGQLQVPFHMAVVGGKYLDIDAKARLVEFSALAKSFGISELSGDLPISEKLVLEKNRVGFSELVTINPFQRVDFDQVRPFLDSNPTLRIGKITWEEKSFGPWVGIVSIEQNRFSLHQFDLDLMSGRVYGEFFFDFAPSILQTGFLGRISDLNFSEILPAKYKKNLSAESQNFSARAGLVFNLRRSTISGRMDITQIGSSQLLAMLNVIDPEFHNEKLNKMRNLLKVGYPTGIYSGFADGYMDLDADLSLVGVTQRQSVHSIPIYGMLAQKTHFLFEQKGETK